MNDKYSFNNIDSLLLQFALQTKEASQKKNEINQQIEICRADIAERRAWIEKINKNIKKLGEENVVKQGTITHNKANAKSIKATNNQLLQYEQTLRAELESRKASYNHDKEVYEDRIKSYRTIFQSHKEYYYQNPLAQKLLMLQAEDLEIESRIKACDDQIMMKQKELDHLTGPAVSSSSPEKLPDGISGLQLITEPEKQLHSQAEEDNDSSIDISSLHLNQSKDGHETSVKANAEEIHTENQVQDTAHTTFPEETSNGPPSFELEEQTWPEVMHNEEQDQDPEPEEHVTDHQATISDTEEEMEEGAAVENEQAPRVEDNEGLTFPQSSQELNPLSSPVPVKAVHSTPVFPFNFSPGSSPHQGASDTKSPAFMLSLNPDPSTPGFSGFGFDVGSAQDEDSSFVFTDSFFNEKKTTESKNSGCPEFLFGQSEESETFHFAFTSKSPQATDKENTRDEFPFSFNF